MEHKMQIFDKNNPMSNFVKSDDILSDMRKIIETSRKSAYQAVNVALIQRNWLIGHRIAEEELGDDGRAEYGLEIIKKLSKELTDTYGKGFTKTICIVFILSIKHFRKFSTHCVENLRRSFRGRITAHYCK